MNAEHKGRISERDDSNNDKGALIILLLLYIIIIIIIIIHCAFRAPYPRHARSGGG